MFVLNNMKCLAPQLGTALRHTHVQLQNWTEMTGTISHSLLLFRSWTSPIAPSKDSSQGCLLWCSAGALRALSIGATHHIRCVWTADRCERCGTMETNKDSDLCSAGEIPQCFFHPNRDFTDVNVCTQNSLVQTWVTRFSFLFKPPSSRFSQGTHDKGSDALRSSPLSDPVTPRHICTRGTLTLQSRTTRSYGVCRLQMTTCLHRVLC